MGIDEALEAARKVLETEERVEIVPTKDGAEVYIIKRRKAKQNTGIFQELDIFRSRTQRSVGSEIQLYIQSNTSTCL